MTICEDPPRTARPRGPDPHELLTLEHDLDTLDRDGVVAVLESAQRARSKLDALEVRAHRRLRELESSGRSEPAHATVTHAASGDSRHGRAVLERDELCLTAPEVEDALDHGTLSGAHLDAMNAATRHLPPELREEFLSRSDELEAHAERLTIDGFRRECRRLAKRLLARVNRDGEVEELERQRAASKVTQWTDKATGMCSTLIEIDPIRNAEMSSAVRGEIARLRQLDGNGDLTWKQLEVQAWVNCVGGSGTSRATDERSTADGARPTRAVDRTPQIIAIADVAMLRSDLADAGSTQLRETSDGADIPAATLRRMCCEAEIIPVVMDGSSRVLDEGRGRRTATPEQRNALRAMHATCAFPGCSVGFDSCRIHHVDWWTRDVGPTDLANLLPVCEHDHHRVHEGGWTASLDEDRVGTWIRPDGAVHHVGPTTDRRPDR